MDNKKVYNHSKRSLITEEAKERTKGSKQNRSNKKKSSQNKSVKSSNKDALPIARQKEVFIAIIYRYHSIIYFLFFAFGKVVVGNLSTSRSLCVVARF